jgi:signal transduction histidine kinase
MKWMSRDTDLDRGLGPIALLLVAIAVPAAFLLWFMNDAVATQAAAARQSVLDAYRSQLRLVRARVDSHWRTHASQLNASGGAPETLFAHLVLEHQADGVVLLNDDGTVAYPQCCEPAQATPVDRQLLAAQSLEENDPRRASALEQMTARLNDYAAAMPAPRRLALMGELRVLAPHVRLPTEAALRLSAAMVGRGMPAVASGSLTPTPGTDVWALASTDRRVVAFYQTGRIQLMMHDVLHPVDVAGARFVALPPGSGNDPEAIAAGPTLPGWQLTFSLLDAGAIDRAARQRAMPYVWIGFGGLVVIAVLGATAGHTFRRHLRLARLKTDLVAAVSHELRTPLSSMRVLVEGLLEDRDLDPVKTREYLGMMAAENTRLSRLIENFLTFSRLERRRYQFVFAPVTPRTIVDAAMETVRDRVPAGCALRVDVEPDVPPVAADADALGTALVNLLDNALKYTGGEKRVLVRVHREDRFVVFSVEDNGIGIPAREQRRIFRRFYRVDQRLARETGGVGLGLSIVALIARAHGGTVTVRSEVARGSTFSLRVPCDVQASPAGAA